MKAEAIQRKRDSIGRRKKVESEEENTLLQSLLQSEKLCQLLRGSVIKSTEKVNYDTRVLKMEKSVTQERESEHLATLDDVGKSIHQQLVLLVEWAKTLTPFSLLCLNDQASILKANAAQLIILGVAYRSMSVENAVCLANDKIITREQANNVADMNFFSAVVIRIIDEVVAPMKALCVDQSEYVALKAILFFNPVSRDISAPRIIEEARLSFLKALISKCQGDECRCGLLLLVLPAISAIAQQLVEDVQLASLFCLANVDTLMQELILHDRPTTIIHQLSKPFPRNLT